MLWTGFIPVPSLSKLIWNACGAGNTVGVFILLKNGKIYRNAYHDSNFESYLNSQGFPESYKASLRTLHTEHPTWVFQAQKTGLNWSDVMEAEGAVGTNLVSKASISSWKSTDYGAYDWNTDRKSVV